MIIEKLRVKNYKSLEDVEVPLRPLTVFVGPNNSGKSNILDCLEFVKELAFLGPPAVGSRNGFHDMVWGGDLKRAIDIELVGQIEDGEGHRRPLKYEVSLTGGPVIPTISKESFSLSIVDFEEQLHWQGRIQKKLLEGRSVEVPEGPPELKLLERAGDFQVRTWSEQEPERETGVWGLGDARLGISSLRGSQDPRHRTLASFASALGDWAFYRFQPRYMGSPGAARKETQLLERGDNVASILISIQTEDRKTFGEIESYLKAAVPEIEELSVGLTEDQRAFFRWREKGLPSDFKVSSWLSSEGTRQILGLLALRFAPRLPPLVCIEEPDNFIHPGLMELMADLLKSMSTKTQVLVSTHSPYLLNQFLPEDLLIVEKKEGKTQITVPKGKKIREALKVLGLGELWYSGDIGGVP